MSNQLQVSGAAKIRDIQGPVVANDGIITALDGLASQYVRGDGALADFPTTTGGGSSVSYYLNGSISQGTIGGVAYKQLSKTPIVGGGTDFTISSPGYVASFITDIGDPAADAIPGGNWNLEFYFNSSSVGGTPYFYVDVYKYDGTTFTLIGSNATAPEYINSGTTLDAYYTAVPIPQTVLATTDRIAMRVYVETSAKTITLHTENTTLCQVVTTFSRGMTTLNNLTKQVQYLAVGTAGTDFNISSVTDIHTFNIPNAGVANRGLITNLTQTIGGAKTFSSVLKTDGGFLLKDSTLGTIDGYTSIGGDLGSINIGYAISSIPYINNLGFTPATSNTYTFPNITGTIALLEGTQTFTGSKTFTNQATFDSAQTRVRELSLLGYSGSSAGALHMYQAAGPSYYGQQGYTDIWSDTSNIIFYIRNATAPFGVKAILDYSELIDNSTQTYTFPNLTGTIALLEGTQTFTGGKTFDAAYFNGAEFINTAYFNKGFWLVKNGTPNVFTPLQTTIYSEATANNVVFRDNVSKAKLIFDNSTQTYTFPAITGTIALTSNLSSYVPYTGATASVDLGVNNLTLGSGNSGAYIQMTGSKGTNYINIENSGSRMTYQMDGFVYTTKQFGGTKTIQVFTDAVTGNNYVIGFPDASGTVALTSNLASYVPYTGATTSLNLGSNSFTTLGSITGGGLKTTNGVQIKYGDVGFGSDPDYLTIESYKVSTATSLRIADGDTLKSSILIFNNSADYTYTFPNASGTLALTSNLSAYLPLTGGTLTGALSGTSATFSLAQNSSTVVSVTNSDNTNANSRAIYRTISGTVTSAFVSISTLGTYIGSETSHNLNLITGGSTRLVLDASTGAATFSNKVQINAPTGTAGFGAIALSIRDVSNQAYGFDFNLEGVATGDLYLMRTNNNVQSTVLQIARSTGAATFSSSVTAGGNIIAPQFYANFVGGGFRGIEYQSSGTIFGYSKADAGGGEYRHYIGPSAGWGGYMTFYTDNTERMRITSAGNVGIGTSSPVPYTGYKTLQIEGTTNGGILELWGNSARQLQIAAGTSSIDFYGEQSTPMIFWTNATERMRITSGGRVLINTTNAGTDFTRTATATAGANVLGLVSTDDSSEGGFIVFRNSATSFIGGISRVGTTNSVNYATSSDYRLKEDLKEIKGLEKLSAIKVYDFKWKDNDARMDGVLAHELQEVLPYAVNGEKDAIDEEGNIKSQGVDYSKIVPVLIKAIQEQQVQIEELNAKIEELRKV